MSMMRSLPLAALSLLLGFFFVFVGTIKLTPKVNPDVYKDMQQEFGRLNKVFPLYAYTGWRPLAKNYRLTVGIVECVCGAILILIPGPLKELASMVLLCILGGAFYTHYALGDPFERMAPALVFGLLVVCRFIIAYQVSQREKKEMQKQATSSDAAAATDGNRKNKFKHEDADEGEEEEVDEESESTDEETTEEVEEQQHQDTREAKKVK